MARGTHAGVQDEGRQAAGGIAFLVLSETNAVAELMKDPGAAPETLRRWRNQSDTTVSAESKRSAKDSMAEFIGMLDDYMCLCSIFFQQVRQRFPAV